MGAAAIPLITMAVAAGAQAHNTSRTAKKQDHQLAESMRGQSRIQQRADGRIQAEVAAMESSRSDDERAKALESYGTQLRRNKTAIDSGLTDQGFGSQAFRERSAQTATDVQQRAGDSAGLMARLDAPTMQRQGEAFSRGHLATDIGLIGREAQGQAFIDDLRLRAIRRSPWIDAAAGVAAGYASTMPLGSNEGVRTGAALNNAAASPSPALPGPFAGGYQYPTRPGYYRAPTWGPPGG